MKTFLPVYKIINFKNEQTESDFYANYFIPHIKHHHIVTKPHKHDFFLIVLFTAGHGTHEIDFTTYKIKPGSVFVMKPGQMHHWTLSEDIDGFVFFHTQDFYDKGFTISSVLNYPFFNSMHNTPLINLSKKSLERVSSLFEEIVIEFQKNDWLKFERLHALVSLAYIELSKNYLPSQKIKNETYQAKLRELERLIDLHFKTKKYSYEYAYLMSLSEKHLNRICKECINKTTGELITDRIILEAKRMLIHGKNTVSEIADHLGYVDFSYFSRLFKKHTGKTPIQFSKKYKL